MSVWIKAFDFLAQLVRYPKPDVKEVARCAESAFSTLHPAMSKAISVFAADIDDLSHEEIEERFTRTFDMDPACALEIGWHLFGESYDRGMFLVWARQRVNEFDIDEESDLPDNLGHCLRILARLDEERAISFSTLCLLPALVTIEPGLAKHENIYTSLFEAIRQLLTDRYGPAAKQEATSLPVLNEHEELFSLEGV